MRKIMILIFMLIFMLVLTFFILSLEIFRQNITGEIISNNKYSYTKAICNETNYCQDYIIICEDNQTINKTPITGAVVQYSKEWNDPRNHETIDNDCNIS